MAVRKSLERKNRRTTAAHMLEWNSINHGSRVERVRIKNNLKTKDLSAKVFNFHDRNDAFDSIVFPTQLLPWLAFSCAKYKKVALSSIDVSRLCGNYKENPSRWKNLF